MSTLVFVGGGITLGVSFLFLTNSNDFWEKLRSPAPTEYVQTDKPKSTKTYLQPEDFVEAHHTWSSRINEVGAYRAYEEFKQGDERSEELATIKKHLFAHVFGALLYESGGIDGLTICDDYAFWGCYHGFFTKAVSEEGALAVFVFDKKCREALEGDGLLACRHGIGHGALAYLGDSRLEEALELCRGLVSLWQPGGCTDGVFMEYAAHTFLGAEYFGLDPRPFDPHNPYDPCLSIPEKFMKSCYFSLPWGWVAALNGDSDQIESLCRGIHDSSFRKACYSGIEDLLRIIPSDL